MGWEPFYLPQPAALDHAGNSEGGSLSHAWAPARFICSAPPPGWVSPWMAGQWPGAACFMKSPRLWRRSLTQALGPAGS